MKNYEKVTRHLAYFNISELGTFSTNLFNYEFSEINHFNSTMIFKMFILD